MSDTRRLWHDYAACWSADPARRLAAPGAVAVDDVAYRDPGTEVADLTERAAYMAGSTGAFPGHRFRIDEVLEHHDRSLAHWARLDAQGESASTGISTARHHEDGRLTDITGFFLPAWTRFSQALGQAPGMRPRDCRVVVPPGRCPQSGRRFVPLRQPGVDPRGGRRSPVAELGEQAHRHLSRSDETATRAGLTRPGVVPSIGSAADTCDHARAGQWACSGPG
ncbi:nuclear transport factor 2 family protein [Kitasatospora sp. NPDC049285]|uniref:nuclear transport factor 2 family protein n=1 Tax=Kitasatospora sp. NPDC049285 TaxID=3157096 RepID=UPI0034278BCE